MQSSQSYAATLTHYSTEPLTTGPDYDPLLLLLAVMCTRTHDRQGNPARSASRTSPAKVPANCVQDARTFKKHSRCSGLRNIADYRRVNGWICTACRTQPQPRAPAPPLSPAHHVRQYIQHTTMERQWNRKQTDGTKHHTRGAQRQMGGHSGVHAHGTINKSQHPELHPTTTGSTPMHRRSLLLYFHNSVSFTRKPLSTTSKNDPHLEELTISIAMDNTELIITNVYIPRPVPAMGVIHHHSPTC